MYPRTPPCPREMEVKRRPTASDVDEVIGHKQSIQHALEDIMDRKASIASVLTMRQQQMRMKTNFYQGLAVKRWEGMENKAKKYGWKMWGKRLMGKKDGNKGKKKGFKML
jgi:hypothetical protein